MTASTDFLRLVIHSRWHLRDTAHMPPRTGDESTQRVRAEVAARVRAAMGYAGLKLDDIVQRCELVTAANLRRTVGAKRDTPAAELLQISQACGVPWSWFEAGEWTANEPEAATLTFGKGSLDERMIVVETYVALLAKAVAIQGIDLESSRLPDTQPRALPVRRRDGVH